MKTGLKVRSVIVLTLILIGGAVDAQVGAPCLVKAAERLIPEKEIILVGFDTASLQGRLVRINLNQSAITISRMINNGIIDTTVSVDNIARIKYRHARLRPGYMLLGTFAAPLLAGIVAGVAGHQSRSSDWGGDLNTGVAILFAGMGGGLLLGTVLPLIFPGHDTIHCDD